MSREARRPRELFVGAELEDVGRLTPEGVADGIQGAEAYGFCLSGFQNRQVCLSDANSAREFSEGYLAPGHHHVEIYNYSHNIKSFRGP